MSSGLQRPTKESKKEKKSYDWDKFFWLKEATTSSFSLPSYEIELLRSGT